MSSSGFFCNLLDATDILDLETLKARIVKSIKDFHFCSLAKFSTVL